MSRKPGKPPARLARRGTDRPARARPRLEALEDRALPSAGPFSETVRFATFNASLNRGAAGQLLTDLATPANAQAATVAEIIQRTRPDVVLINEFDYYPDLQAANLFRDNYLEVAHN